MQESVSYIYEKNIRNSLVCEPGMTVKFNQLISIPTDWGHNSALILKSEIAGVAVEDGNVLKIILKGGNVFTAFVNEAADIQAQIVLEMDWD